jgi:hypothetical protein
MTAPHPSPPPRHEDAPSIASVVELVKTYAKQETLGPLKGAGKWLAWGAAAALVLGLGLTLVTLGVLRLVQTEWDRSARGSLSWLAYVIAFVVCVVFLVLALSRINKDSLSKETK